MIKKFYIIVNLLIFFILFSGLSEARQGIVIVQSIRVRPYEKAIEGFKSVCDAEINRLVVSKQRRASVVEKIYKIRPDMVLAIGMGALSRVKWIKDIPVVYLMVMNPQSILYGAGNITGVSMTIPPERQLHLFLEAMPHMRTIGFLYDAGRTGYLAKKARDAAGKFGIKLIAKQVHSSREVPALIKAMRGRIDVFWMLPDLTVITPETIEVLLLLSIESKIPILSFSEKYVELGALMSIGIDAFDMGCQAGEIAKAIISGRHVMDLQEIDARKAVISINLKVARKLGIKIDEKFIRKARVID